MILKQTVKVAGSASFSVIRADGTVKEFVNEERTLRSGEPIKNTVLDNFFSRMRESTQYKVSAAIKLGTGNSPTDVAQTTLEAPYRPLHGNHARDYSPYFSSRTEGDYRVYKAKFNFLFDVGQLSGNFSEVGIDYAANIYNYDSMPSNTSYSNHPSNNSVNTRLLITDAQGNPTTITILADEQLKISYSLEAKIPDQPVTTTAVLLSDGVPSDINITCYRTENGTFQSLFNSNFGFSNQTSSNYIYAINGTIGSTTVGMQVNKEAKATKDEKVVVGNTIERRLEWDSTTANFADGINIISPFTWGNGRDSNHVYKWAIDPPIQKDNTKRLRLTMVVEFARA